MWGTVCNTPVLTMASRVYMRVLEAVANREIAMQPQSTTNQSSGVVYLKNQQKSVM